MCVLTNLVSLQRLFGTPVYFDSSLRTGDHACSLASGCEPVQSERYLLLLFCNGTLYQRSWFTNRVSEGEEVKRSLFHSSSFPSLVLLHMLPRFVAPSRRLLFESECIQREEASQRVRAISNRASGIPLSKKLFTCCSLVIFCKQGLQSKFASGCLLLQLTLCYSCKQIFCCGCSWFILPDTSVSL